MHILTINYMLFQVLWFNRYIVLHHHFIVMVLAVIPIHSCLVVEMSASPREHQHSGMFKHTSLGGYWTDAYDYSVLNSDSCYKLMHLESQWM